MMSVTGAPWLCSMLDTAQYLTMGVSSAFSSSNPGWKKNKKRNNTLLEHKILLLLSQKFTRQDGIPPYGQPGLPWLFCFLHSYNGPDHCSKYHAGWKKIWCSPLIVKFCNITFYQIFANGNKKTTMHQEPHKVNILIWNSKHGGQYWQLIWPTQFFKVHLQKIYKLKGI